jgi:hypothetical protein
LHALGGRELAKGIEPEARIVHRPDIPREPRQADLRRRENLDLVPSDDRCAARTDNLAQRRLQTGADYARADAPSRQLSIPATDTLNNSLNHQPELWLPASRVTNRLEGHGAPALTPSASAKSP